MTSDKRRPGRSFVASFADAFRGLRFFWLDERNARIEVVIAAAVVAAGVLAHFERWEWVAATFAIGLVWTAEGLNSAIETLADALHPDDHPLIGRAKDIASAAVLLAAFTAAAVGFILLIPRLAVLAS